MNELIAYRTTEHRVRTPIGLFNLDGLILAFARAVLAGHRRCRLQHHTGGGNCVRS